MAAARDIALTGEVEQPRIRFWSTQLTVPTDAGLLWFKENCPGQSFEARLVALLAELVPDHVVAPLGVEPGRGWFLTADAGKTLADDAGTDLQVWVRVVQEWADVQRKLAPHTEQLRAAGVVGVPLTLDHNDLHAHNAFVLRPGEARLRFFDFGDALLGHPFCSLMVPVRMLTRELDADPGDPRVQRVVDAYLECWSDLADRATLRAALDSAMRLGGLHRAESWRRVLPSANAAGSCRSSATHRPGG